LMRRRLSAGVVVEPKLMTAIHKHETPFDLRADKSENSISRRRRRRRCLKGAL
jgi:hypothetical protein